MGCAFSRKQSKRFHKKAKISRYSPAVSSATVNCQDVKLSVPPNKPALPDIKCHMHRLHENLGQFSTLAFMAGDKLGPIPDCLTYEGYHEYGFHIVNINSDEYIRDVESMGADCILDAVRNLTAGERFIIIYRSKNGGPAYLPDVTMYARAMFHDLATKFGPQLLKIVVFKPSWYVLWCLDCQARTGRHFFSETAMGKLNFACNVSKFAKLTGFPGEIKLH